MEMAGHEPRSGFFYRSQRAIERHARLLWWIAAGGPPLFAVALMLIEPLDPPPLARSIDLSEALYNIASLLTALMGIVMIWAAGNRVKGQLHHAFEASDLPPGVRLQMAREARVRAAWLVLVGIILVVLGMILCALPEDALVKPDHTTVQPGIRQQSGL